MKSVVKSNPIVRAFKFAFGGMLGIISAEALVALFSIFFVGIGYAIIVRFNKKDTKDFEDLQPMQYIGIVLCLIGLLPWMQYLFMGFMEGAGISLFNNIFK